MSGGSSTVHLTPSGSTEASGGGAAVSAEYRFQTSIVEADPGNGNFRMDNATPASVTELFISSITDAGFDFDTILGLISAGDQIYIQQDNDASKFILFDVTANVDNTGWFSIAGTINSSGTIFDNNAKCHILILFGGSGPFGDVFKVGTPVVMEVGVWTGDGTLEGNDNFQWDTSVTSGRVEIKCVDNTINEIGLFLIDPNSVLNPDGWQWCTGQAGLHDGTLILSHKPADVINNRDVTYLPGGRPTFGFGIAIAPDTQLADEQVGALAFFQPRDTTGREETKVSFVGEVGGTGHEGLFSIEGFAYGDSGLVFARLCQFVMDSDGTLHIDSYGKINIGSVGALPAPVVAGDNSSMGYSQENGMELTGQGTDNDFVIFDDTHQLALSKPTGSAGFRFHQRFSVTRFTQFEQGNTDFAITSEANVGDFLIGGYSGLLNIDSDLEVEGNGVYGPGTGSVTLDIDSGTADFLSGELRFLAAGIEQAHIQWFEFAAGGDSLLINSVTGKMQIFTSNTLAMEIATDQSIRYVGTQEWDKGANIASAATLVLGTDGNSFTVTGTTDITAISAKPIGTVIILQFAAAVELVYDATALDLSGDVSMVTEADDTLGLYCYDGTNWRELFRTDGQNVRVSGSIADQSMVRGNGGAKRVQDTGNLIGDDDEIIMAGTVILQNFTDAQLNDNGNSVNTNDGKAAGAMVFNSDQGHAVTAQGSGAGDVWNDGVGTTTNTPV